MIKYLSILSISLLLLINCSSPSEKPNKPMPFKALYADELIVIDGLMNEQSWKKAPSSQFNYHYNVETLSDEQVTNFRMLWDENNIYLHYQCQDKYITARETKRDGATFLDDCAEFFLSPSKDNPQLHFCFEINLNKVCNDIIYLNDFESGNDVVIKGYNPPYEVAVTIDGTVNDNSDIDKGWTMEVAIPLSAFNRYSEVNPIQNKAQWSFLALRQNRDDIEGERRVTSIIYPNHKIENDVHQPEFFGIVEFISHH